MSITGTLYIISAPSGAGKSSLIEKLLQTPYLRNVQISVSHTTRNIRPGENHGQHYFFVSRTEFEAMITQEYFIEYAEIFGNYYGTSRIMIEKILTTGVDIFLDIDWQGAQQIRRKTSQVKSIFILPPSIKELNKRLCKRRQDSDDIIDKRMKEAIKEINHYHEYDYLIINNQFDLALADLQAIVYANRLRTNRQKNKYRNLISKLLEI